MLTFDPTLFTFLEFLVGSLIIELLMFLYVVDGLTLATVFTSEFVASEIPFCNNGLNIFANFIFFQRKSSQQYL